MTAANPKEAMYMLCTKGSDHDIILPSKGYSFKTSSAYIGQRNLLHVHSSTACFTGIGNVQNRLQQQTSYLKQIMISLLYNCESFIC